jgi:hypothetical protein
MRTHVSARKMLLLLGTAVLAGAVLAAGVVAAHLRAPQSPEEVDAALKGAPLVKVADIPSAPGRAARGAFAQVGHGLVCLWDAPSATSPARQGGCNHADDPLGGHLVSASLAYDGGPAARAVRDARIIGLVAPAVAAVEVAMTDGTVRHMALRTATVAGAQYRAFGYRFRATDFRRGVGPKAVVALDTGGKEIDRQPTGFGS